MESKIEDLSSKVEKVVKEQAGHVSKPLDIQAEIHEALEREKKRNNVVIVGHIESDKSVVRCEDDKNFVKNVCGTIGLNVDCIQDVFRDGKLRPDPDPVNGKYFSRIMKVKFENLGSKMDFLKGFRANRPTGSKAYARHDQTHQERLADKALQAKLHSLRDAYPDADLMIYRGKICNRADKSIFVPPDRGDNGQA